MKTSVRLLLLIALVCTAFLVASPVLASGGGWNILGQHVVKPGETLYCIGRAYGVDPWAIAVQNNVVYANTIHPGLVLNIPNAPAVIVPGPVCQPQFGTVPPPPTPVPQPVPSTCGGCACSLWHTVVPGNTLTQIALLYGKDMWSIAQCNCILDLNYIRSGDALCIP